MVIILIHITQSNKKTRSTTQIIIKISQTTTCNISTHHENNNPTKTFQKNTTKIIIVIIIIMITALWTHQLHQQPNLQYHSHPILETVLTNEGACNFMVTSLSISSHHLQLLIKRRPCTMSWCCSCKLFTP